MPDQEALLLQSLHKTDDPISKASLLKNLHSRHGVSTKRLAKELGVSEPYISSLMRLLKLPDLVIDGFYSKQISFTHLLVLSRLDIDSQVVRAYEEVLTQNLSTVLTDDLVRTMKYGVASNRDDIASEELKQKIKTKIQKIHPDVKIKVLQTRMRTKITLEQKGPLHTTTKTLEAFEKLVS